MEPTRRQTHGIMVWKSMKFNRTAVKSHMCMYTRTSWIKIKCFSLLLHFRDSVRYTLLTVSGVKCAYTLGEMLLLELECWKEILMVWNDEIMQFDATCMELEGPC